DQSRKNQRILRPLMRPGELPHRPPSGRLNREYALLGEIHGPIFYLRLAERQAASLRRTDREPNSGAAISTENARSSARYSLANFTDRLLRENFHSLLP